MYHDNEPACATESTNPSERLQQALNQLAEAVDRVHGAVSRTHSATYGEFNYPPSADANTEAPVPAGRVASFQETVNNIHVQVRLTEQIAESLESCA